MRRTPQTALPFPHRVDPDWCASTVKHLRKRARPTHVVTFEGQQSFRVCEPCSRPYIGMRNTSVDEIKETQ